MKMIVMLVRFPDKCVEQQMQSTCQQPPLGFIAYITTILQTDESGNDSTHYCQLDKALSSLLYAKELLKEKLHLDPNI